MKASGREGILTVKVSDREGILTVKVSDREGILTVKVSDREGILTVKSSGKEGILTDKPFLHKNPRVSFNRCITNSCRQNMVRDKTYLEPSLKV